MKYIKQFAEISNDDILLVGGKAVSLGIMTTAGLPIPSGFVVTTDTYKEYHNQKIPENVQQDILHAFALLQADRVAVRSSAVSEDSSTSSWAGQFDTYLNVTKENLLESIKNCWESVNSERALAYARDTSLSLVDSQQVMAVVVQEMITSDVSGVMFSVNPITKNHNEIMIEAAYGLGEMLVQGLITPANFIFDKSTMTVKSKIEGQQDKMLVLQDGENKVIPLPDGLLTSEILLANDLKQLVSYAKTIEKMYNRPQDIEWAKQRNSFYILQSRPITTF